MIDDESLGARSTAPRTDPLAVIISGHLGARARGYSRLGNSNRAANRAFKLSVASVSFIDLFR